MLSRLMQEGNANIKQIGSSIEYLIATNIMVLRWQINLTKKSNLIGSF